MASVRLTFWGKNDPQGRPVMYPEHKERYLNAQARRPGAEWYMILKYPDDNTYQRDGRQNRAMHYQWNFVAKEIGQDMEDVKRDYLRDEWPIPKAEIIQELLDRYKPTDLWPTKAEYDDYLHNEAVIKPRGRASSDLDDREAEEAIRFGIPAWALHEHNVVIPKKGDVEETS